MNPALSITDEQWRAVGYTPTAARWPLSEDATRILAFANGLRLDQVPVTWHYAPNEAVQRQSEALVESPINSLAKLFNEEAGR